MADLWGLVAGVLIVAQGFLWAGIARENERARWLRWLMTQDDDVLESAHEWMKGRRDA